MYWYMTKGVDDKVVGVNMEDVSFIEGIKGGLQLTFRSGKVKWIADNPEEFERKLSEVVS